MYIVIKDFKDLEDNDYIYISGDEYPRKGKSIEDIPLERINALSSNQNKLGRVLIKKIDTKETTADEPEEDAKETTADTPGEDTKGTTTNNSGTNSKIKNKTTTSKNK